MFKIPSIPSSEKLTGKVKIVICKSKCYCICHIHSFLLLLQYFQHNYHYFNKALKTNAMFYTQLTLCFNDYIDSFKQNM